MLARIARTSSPLARRSFTASAAIKADLVQDLYLKELRAYKVPQTKPSDAEGHVQKFQAPAPPKSPEESNLASEMKAYEDQQVEVEGQASTGEAAEPEDDYFEDLKQFDESLTHGEGH